MRKTDAAILLLKNFSSGLTIPVLSMILLNKGCSLAQIAVTIGAYSVTAVLLELPTGIFADRYGRKNCFLVSLAIGCASTLLLLATHGLVMITLAMALSGASRAFGSGSMDALLIDRELEQSGQDGLSKVSTQLSLLETAGVAFGSIAGGLISSAMLAVTPQRPYDAVLLLRLILSLCAGILAYRFTEEPPRKEDCRPSLKQYVKDGTLLVGKNPVILLLTMGGLVTGFIFSTVEMYWQPSFTAMLKNQSMLWLLGFLSFGCQTFASLGSVAMQRALRTGKIKNLAGYNAMRLAMGVFLLLLAAVQSAAGFGIWYLVLYFSLGAANIAESVLFNLEIPNDYRAGMLSFFSLITQGGNFLSSIVAGIVISFKGVSVLWFWESFVLILISVGIGMALIRVKHKADSQPNES